MFKNSLVYGIFDRTALMESLKNAAKEILSLILTLIIIAVVVALVVSGIGLVLQAFRRK
jgi:hypothetical protein